MNTPEPRFAWVEHDPDGNPMNCVVTAAGGVTMMNRHLDAGHTSTTRPARPGETTSDLIAETFPPDPTATSRHLMTIRFADL